MHRFIMWFAVGLIIDAKASDDVLWNSTLRTQFLKSFSGYFNYS